MKNIWFLVFELIAAGVVRYNNSFSDFQIFGARRLFRDADVHWPTTGIPHGGTLKLSSHNGPVLTSPNIYVIFYGNNYWTSSNAAMYVTFLKNLGTSNYMKHTVDYYKTGTPTYKAGVILNGGSTTNEVSTFNGITSIIKKQITAGVFGSKVADPQGIYLLLTDPYKSKYLKTSNSHVFNVDFCGSHDFTSLNGAKFAFGFVGLTNTGKCGYSFKTATYTSTPSQDKYRDYVNSVLAHEVKEVMTVPFGSSWYDSLGYEIADKCSGWPGASNLLSGATSSNGPLYNAVIGGEYYLIETNYDNNKLECIQAIW